MAGKISVLLILLVLQCSAQLQPAIDTSCLCGQRQVSPFGQIFGTRVVGGEEAGVGEFPWAALLSIKARGRKPVRCGGSLISDRYDIFSLSIVECVCPFSTA